MTTFVLRQARVKISAQVVLYVPFYAPLTHLASRLLIAALFSFNESCSNVLRELI